MNVSPYEYIDINSNNINILDYVEVYKKYGVVVFRGFFNGDEIFENYYNDLKQLCITIAEKHKLSINYDLNLNEFITALSIKHRKEVAHIYDLGTRPIKILSGTILKTHPVILEFIKLLFGVKLIGFPYQGETLHIFPPGKENVKYNLPMHQDYPYLMQSPDQITVYANLGFLQPENNGGIKVWLKSHSDGIATAKLNKNRYWETRNRNYYEEKYQCKKLFFDRGDLAIFNSLIQHKGIQNHSNCTRIVQLIRYSNLLHNSSVGYSWRSSGGDGNDNVFKNS